MKKLRLFDSLKFVLATVACVFILNVAHAATTAIQSVIAYGKTEQSATPTPTNPVPIMTNNGVLKVSPNLFRMPTYAEIQAAGTVAAYKSIPLKLEPNTTYYLSTTYLNGYTSKGKNIYGLVTISPTDNGGWKAFAHHEYGARDGSLTTNDDGFIYLRFHGMNQQLLDDLYANAQIQLEKGSTATAYKPYGTGVADDMVETIRDSAGHTATAQMLLSVGDYKDEQSITTGAITRRVGVRVFDGTENWYFAGASYPGVFFLANFITDARTIAASEASILLCSHFVASPKSSAQSITANNVMSINSNAHTPNSVWIYSNNFSTVAQFKAWLAEQYANGTPVIVVYPLATETTENVTTQTLTTAPVRQTAGSILGMPIEVVLGDGTREWVSEIITIATTKYNEQQFAPVETRLDAAVAAVDTVVSQTMTQAQAIDTIATSKQTRPDESCPPFKKCLLVEDEDGTPHWYEIYDPINDFLNPILAAAGLSGNQGAPTQTSHSDGSSTIIDTSNIFYNGSMVFQRKYIDSTAGAVDRPFGPTTLPRCADNATRTTSPSEAGICYNTGGMFRTLTEGSDDDAGEWALVWNGAEGGASLGITPGVVYGVAKCTTVGHHTTEMTGDVQSGSEYWWPKKLTGYSGGGTTLASLIEQYPNSNVENVFNTLPNPVGTDDNPEYPRANYGNCWCKMTAIGVPGAGDTPDQRYANGTIMSVSGGWVFGYAAASATYCAGHCARICAYYVRAYPAFRKNVLTVR